MKKPEPTKLDTIVRKIVAEKGLLPDGDHYDLAEEIVAECIHALEISGEETSGMCIMFLKNHFGR